MVQYEYIRNIYPSGDDCKLRLLVEYLLCDCVIRITPVTWKGYFVVKDKKLC